MNLRETTRLLMSERVPPGYDGPQADTECKRLAPLFLAEDSWAANHGPSVEPEELDELIDRLVRWVRARGYPFMDGPAPPYGMPPSKDSGPWKPVKPA
jgi:hypothetical protein